MGVLDDAIREHLDLKRRHGASEEEIARAEAEALTPARRPAPPPVADLEDAERELAEADHDGEDDRHDSDDDGGPGRLIVEPVDDVAPPPVPTRAVHDIDEDPMPAPAHGHESENDGATVESDPVDRPDADDAGREPGRLSD